MFGWGHHPADPMDDVFSSCNTRVVAIFENLFDAYCDRRLSTETITTNRRESGHRVEEGIQIEEVCGEWIIFEWRDENTNEKKVANRLTIEEAGAGIVLRWRKVANEAVDESSAKSAKWEHGKLWFVSEQRERYGGEGRNIEAGWYQFNWNENRDEVECHGRMISEHKNIKVDGYRPGKAKEYADPSIKALIEKLSLQNPLREEASNEAPSDGDNKSRTESTANRSFDGTPTVPAQSGGVGNGAGPGNPRHC
jgi:hypothetical protein